MLNDSTTRMNTKQRGRLGRLWLAERALVLNTLYTCRLTHSYTHRSIRVLRSSASARRRFPFRSCHLALRLSVASRTPRFTFPIPRSFVSLRLTAPQFYPINNHVPPNRPPTHQAINAPCAPPASTARIARPNPNSHPPRDKPSQTPHLLPSLHTAILPPPNPSTRQSPPHRNVRRIARGTLRQPSRTRNCSGTLEIGWKGPLCNARQAETRHDGGVCRVGRCCANYGEGRGVGDDGSRSPCHLAFSLIYSGSELFLLL